MKKNAMVSILAILILATTSSIIPNFASNVIKSVKEKEINTIVVVDPDMNIENDKGSKLENLPHFLDGTILDGNTRVIVSENGLPPPDVALDDYDIVISFEDEERIVEEAREKFIDTYGIDPCPPEQEKPKIRFNELFNVFLKVHSKSDRSSGPHQVGGYIVTKIIYAKDSKHKPVKPAHLGRETKRGFDRFQLFNVNTFTYEYYGIWDASDAESDDAEDILDDFVEDNPRSAAFNIVLIGWVFYMTGHNGLAGDFWCVARERSSFSPSVLAQHELSHLFGAEGDDWFWPSCVMTYLWLWFGWSMWCSDCRNTIHDQIWNWS